MPIINNQEALPGPKDSIDNCLQQLKGGDPAAAQNLWDRYYHRLIGLARTKLGDSSRRAMDEDDVVQNAFNSFCSDAQAGHFPDLCDRDSLWALLALIIARKAANQRMHEGRAKRDSGRVAKGTQWDETGSVDFGLLQVIERQPSVEDASDFVAELDRFMDSLDDPSHRLILLWKLELRTNPEMARHLDCSLSEVERKLRFIRKRLLREVPEN